MTDVELERAMGIAKNLLSDHEQRLSGWTTIPTISLVLADAVLELQRRLGIVATLAECIVTESQRLQRVVKEMEKYVSC